MYRLDKVNLRRLWWISALVIGSLVIQVGFLRTNVFAAPSTHSVLTLKEFQRRQFSLVLPIVPTSMVAAPPKSQARRVETRLPAQVLRALYYQSENPIFGPPPGLGPHPTRSTILSHLPGAVGPARVYTVPHRQAVFWAFGSAILHAQQAHLPVQPGIPVGWQTFIRAMSQHYRIAQTVRGTLGAPPTLPKTMPDANAWTVAVYHHANPKKMPYLSEIDVVVHQNTVWILFRGDFKLNVSPNTRVPVALVPAPSSAESVASKQVPVALQKHFGALFTANPWLPLSGIRNMARGRWSLQTNLTIHSAMRVYHGSPTTLRAWLRTEAQRLTAVDLSGGSTGQGTWRGIQWMSLYRTPDATPWRLYLFVTPKGWAAIGAGYVKRN